MLCFSNSKLEIFNEIQNFIKDDSIALIIIRNVRKQLDDI